MKAKPATSPPNITARDTLYRRPQDLVDFRFDSKVVEVFPDMIRRSIPGYETTVALSGWLASRHLQDGSKLYDLGCSLLAGTLAAVPWCAGRAVRFIGVDSSPEMLARAAELIAETPEAPQVELRCEDVESTDISDADAVLLNYTLQFVAPERRDAVLSRIHAGLRPGGILLISEKLAFSDPREAAFFEAAHRDFKRANGYSETEIEQKRAALENVMRPDTEAVLRARIEHAGFTEVHTWQRCLNWISIAAFRG